MPTDLTTLTWGFATGECGTENWAGLPGSAVAAANVQNFVSNETFTLGNVGTLAAYARQKHLAGLHFRSFDRDTDCAPGYASPICNSYGTAGRLGFTMQFLSSLGL